MNSRTNKSAGIAGDGTRSAYTHIAEQLAEMEGVENAWGTRPVEWLLQIAEVDSR